jgi:hypothetical protein
MPRTLIFDQIDDTRFGGSQKSLLIRTKLLYTALEHYDGISVKKGELRTVSFGKTGNEERSTTWKVNFQIQKHSKNISWDELYTVINSFKAPSYRFINAALMVKDVILDNT